MLIADDIGTDYFGFYKDHKDTVDLPNIRGLLKNGVLFTNAMSNPVCSATRAGILTGRYSFRTGVGNIVGSGSGSGQLDTSEITIPRLLKIFNPNIAKANIGKWHLHNPAPASNLLNPLVLGYDHFEGPFIGALPSYTNWTKYINGVSGTITNYATSENINNAVSWIKLQTVNPFFIWLAFNAPHSPYHLPPSNLHTFSALSGTQQDIAQNPKSYFKAALQALDTEIGRLFDSLQVLNKLDSTDFIFIGDNGNATRTAQIADTSRAKGTIYQYGVHVPFIISGPSVINPGRTSDALINTTDIFATIPELFGYFTWQAQIPVNKPVDAKSILPIVKNQNSQIKPWSFTEIFKTITDSADGKAMRNTDYKLLNFDYGHQEFFNLSNDSNEMNDLLLGTLSSADITNYFYLCNEMSTLVGTAGICNSSVGYPENENEADDIAFPNPFGNHIFLKNKSGNEICELSDLMGRKVFTGKFLEEENFSFLPEGIFFLKVYSNQKQKYFRLFHHN